MLNPKEFYRELDSTLAKIERAERNENFLFQMFNDLEQKFGGPLKIARIHIFELRGNEYIRLSRNGEDELERIKQIMPKTNQVVQLVEKHGSYIFDDWHYLDCFFTSATSEYVVPAAISLHSPDQSWIIAFELNSGWVREEITLFLNSLRTALNYRLFSEQISGELEQAARIQKSLLPTESPAMAGYEIFGRSQPAEIVGGDFYEYFQLEPGSLGVSIGDASGHGLPAALLVRDVVIGLRMGLEKEFRLVYTISKLNGVVQRSTYSTHFISLFIGEIETDGHFFYVNAGHPPPILVKGKNAKELDATGITLGFLPEIDLHRAYVYIEQGSVLVLYTDGLIERENQQGELFGRKNLIEFVKQKQYLSAKEIADSIFSHLFEYGDRTAWADDATVVVIKRLKKEEA
jgi:sigma-B regulation protein RsbU (phosphoserine phosphatase)